MLKRWLQKKSPNNLTTFFEEEPFCCYICFHATVSFSKVLYKLTNIYDLGQFNIMCADKKEPL